MDDRSVQRGTAIGKPPDGVLCLFRHLKNVVVLPCVDMYIPGSNSRYSSRDMPRSTSSFALQSPVLFLPCLVEATLTGASRLPEISALVEYRSSDLYAVIKESTLLPPIHHDPAEYEPVGTRTLDRDSTIDDICDFIVEYINSDVLVRHFQARCT